MSDSTITFSGLGSGMDYSSWIDALVEVKQQSVTKIEEKIEAKEKAQSALSTIKSEFSSLNSAISTFTDSKISAFDIFSRKKATTSDDNKTATATVSNSATVQNFELFVNQLATSTVATGTNPLGQIASMDTKLKDLNNKVIKDGDVSLYVNDKKYVFTVDDETTLQDFCDFIGEKTGGTATISSDGKLSIDLEGSGTTNVKLGSNSDTGNLLDFFGFKTETDDDGNVTGFSSSKILTKISTSEPILSSANLSGSITAGTFKIGNQEFTIDETTSISGLIYQINSNSDSGVTASYDAVSNKLVLKSREPGCTTINVEAGTSNFTDVIGWTDGDGGLAAGSQVLGKNAIFTINGEQFEAASNTIGEDVTGITGLTLTLNKTSKEGEEVQVNISNDLTEVETAIETFIERYNKLKADVEEVTDSSTGYLPNDSSLRGMLSELSTTIMNLVPGLTTYNCMASVGVSTGAAKTDVSSVSTDLTFDKTKFEEAMNKNPAEVKKLFVNNDSTDSSLNGVMTKLETLVDGYLDVESGYFAIKEDSFETQIETLNQSLTRKQESIEAYRERLEKQFQSMDSYISTMNSYSTYISQLSSSSSS